MLLNSLKAAFAFFLFSSFYISCCAVGMAFQTAYLFNLPHSCLFYAFVFCGTVCSYNLHWAFTPKLFQNPIQAIKGLELVPIWVHVILAFVAFLVAGFLFVLLRQHWYWLVCAGFLSFLYTAPMIPVRVTRFLRKIAFGKTIFLTFAWTYITAMLPLLITDTAIETQHIIFCINRFFLIYAICILFDLRDRENDLKQGIRSMITEYTLPAVDRIYWGSLVVYFKTTIALAPYFNLPVIWAFAIPGFVLFFGYTWFKNHTSVIVYNFILDGLMVFSLPLLRLFRI